MNDNGSGLVISIFMFIAVVSIPFAIGGLASIIYEIAQKCRRKGDE